MIRWTAPFSGVAALTATFEGLNPFGTTTDAHVWHNGTALDTASVNGVGVSSRVGFHETLPVVLGDTLDFGVGKFSEESLLTRDYEIALHHHYDRKGYWIDELAEA